MDSNEIAEELSRQIGALMETRDASTDEAVRKDLLAEIKRLRRIVIEIDLTAADQLARDIDAAADALEAVRTEFALDAVAALSRSIQKLREVEASLKQAVKHPPAQAANIAIAITAPMLNAAASVAAAAAASNPFKTLKAKQFSQLRDEYTSFFNQCSALPSRQALVDGMAQKVRNNRARYEAVAGPLGMPWAMVGVIHSMEASLSFATHLHNGDPLTARTHHVPAGRPANGNPPFTWEESAIDALKLMNFDSITDWSTARMLFELERYNGFGYRQFELPSPYLWSFSNIYRQGKFINDGIFDPEAVSKQCGAALLLKALI